MSVGLDKVSKREPCQICGKPDWCFRLDLGRIHCCRRMSHGGIEKEDKSGCTYWIHFEEDKNGKKCRS